MMWRVKERRAVIDEGRMAVGGLIESDDLQAVTVRIEVVDQGMNDVVQAVGQDSYRVVCGERPAVPVGGVHVESDRDGGGCARVRSDGNRGDGVIAVCYVGPGKAVYAGEAVRNPA